MKNRSIMILIIIISTIMIASSSYYPSGGTTIINWSIISTTSFPLPCPGNSAIVQLNNSVTCADYWIDAIGDSVLTGNLNITENTTSNYFIGDGSLLTNLPNGGAGITPIGSIIAWSKTLTNTPALSEYFLECNGQTVSDEESPYDGQVIPDLNSGTQRFLRGSNTSGSTGGSETHTHGMNNAQSYWDIASSDSYPSPANHLPPYYEVVWIIRIK